jgi:hypothetical protein
MKKHRQCPTEEMLLDFLQQRLSGNDRKRVELHLAQCSLCRESASVYADVALAEMVEEPVPVPAGVTERTVEAVREIGRQGLAGRLARTARNAFEKGDRVWERLSWVPGPSPVAVRGDGDASYTDIIRREKHFGDLRVIIEIEKKGGSDAAVRITPESALSTGSVRVTLLRNEREIASGTVGQRPVVFDTISPDSYVLVFSGPEGIRGEYAFEIVDPCHE